MLSRVAERMYWAGRYLARIEATARLIKTYASLLLDLPANTAVGWPQILRILSAEHYFRSRYDSATEANVLTYLLADKDNPGSLLTAIEQLRENMRTCRDIVPTEGWESVNELHLLANRELPLAVAPRNRYATLSDIVVRCQLLDGLLSSTMSHGYGYNFWRVGTYLERADMTSRVVDVAAATLANADKSTIALGNTLWMGVLKSVSAYQMYRQYVRRRVTADDVVQFLLSDAQFPRSMGFTVTALARNVSALPKGETLLPLVQRLEDELERVAQAQMITRELHESIDRLQLGLASVHHNIETTWFLRR